MAKKATPKMPMQPTQAMMRTGSIAASIMKPVKPKPKPKGKSK